MKNRVVIIQSEEQSSQLLAQYFSQHGDEVWQTGDLDQARELITNVNPGLMIMDLHITHEAWRDFLRWVRQDNPEIKIIMTNKHPDLQREMLVRELGVRVILRQPFSPRWIEQALKRLEDGGESVELTTEEAKSLKTAESKRSVRMPVRVKITLPYLLLVLVFALASAYLVSRVLIESVQESFLNHLVDTAKLTTDWMVREESRLLATLRSVANTQGAAEAVANQDVDTLRGLILPVIFNSGDEVIEILNPEGVSILSIQDIPGEAGYYRYTQGDATFQTWPFVQHVVNREFDRYGDKFAGLGDGPWRNYFYVSGPLLDDAGHLVGIVLVGKSLPSLVYQMKADTLGEITLYTPDGIPLISTFDDRSKGFPLTHDQVKTAQDQSGGSTSIQSLTRDLQIVMTGYTELLAPWEVRSTTALGVIGVSLEQTFLVRNSLVTQIQIFALVIGGILLVLFVGVYLANRITQPLLRLVRASGDVAQGNLEVKVEADGNDEVAVLAQSFNYMVAGLQEGSIYRDLLGRTVSPEVREQLRQTFTNVNLRLEGQQAVASVLMSDIRGFTSVSEQVDAATVFRWLNEYFSRVVPIVAAHGGVVNKFDGDAMLAFFGILPRLLTPEESAKAACQSALEILEAIDEVNRERVERGDPPFITGIGVNTGPVIAGGLGTSDRLHYTIIGDTVNTTQRIEALTRSLMTVSGVLVSHATMQALGPGNGFFALQEQGAHMLKGKAEPVQVYRLLPGQTGVGGSDGPA